MQLFHPVVAHLYHSGFESVVYATNCIQVTMQIAQVQRWCCPQGLTRSVELRDWVIDSRQVGHPWWRLVGWKNFKWKSPIAKAPCCWFCLLQMQQKKGWWHVQVLEPYTTQLHKQVVTYPNCISGPHSFIFRNSIEKRFYLNLHVSLLLLSYTFTSLPVATPSRQYVIVTNGWN